MLDLRYILGHCITVCRMRLECPGWYQLGRSTEWNKMSGQTTCWWGEKNWIVWTSNLLLSGNVHGGHPLAGQGYIPMKWLMKTKCCYYDGCRGQPAGTTHAQINSKRETQRHMRVSFIHRDEQTSSNNVACKKIYMVDPGHFIFVPESQVDVL